MTNTERSAYLVGGGGVVSPAALAFLVRDLGLAARNIHMLPAGAPHAAGGVACERDGMFQVIGIDALRSGADAWIAVGEDDLVFFSDHAMTDPASRGPLRIPPTVCRQAAASQRRSRWPIAADSVARCAALHCAGVAVGLSG